jgi:hypothetical protein
VVSHLSPLPSMLIFARLTHKARHARHSTPPQVPLYERGYEKDPAKVAHEAVKAAARDGLDVVLVDTAGRMQVRLLVVCVRVCACVCARRRVCVRACVRACVRVHAGGRLPPASRFAASLDQRTTPPNCPAPRCICAVPGCITCTHVTRRRTTSRSCAR